MHLVTEKVLRRIVSVGKAGMALALFAVGSALAQADINIGLTISATGPAASLGIPIKNTVPLLPTTIAGQKINYIVLDDATDPAQATRNARRFVTEDKVDAIIGSSTVPGALAVTEVAVETKTPQIALAPTPVIPDKNAWVFRMPQHNGLMARALVAHMKATNIKTLGFIGYADSFGEGFLNELKKALDGSGIDMNIVERYNRTDTSVTGQAIKVLSANPDAVLIVGSGTPAALPQTTLIERGYKGKFYQSHGAASRDFLRVGGKALEGTMIALGPVIVANQLPDSHPSKKLGVDYTKRYEGMYGADTVTPFGAHLVDASKLLEAAVPVALKKAKPGTAEFRQALRDALESSREVVATHGVFNMSPNDHYGHDERARVLVRVENGNWKMVSAK